MQSVCPRGSTLSALRLQNAPQRDQFVQNGLKLRSGLRPKIGGVFNGLRGLAFRDRFALHDRLDTSLPEQPLNAADRVTLGVEKVANAAQQGDVFGPVVTPAAAEIAPPPVAVMLQPVPRRARSGSPCTGAAE